jgi:uncharacterized protein with ACT and thioredoxin-like domain
MSAATENELKLLAEQYNCIYDGKPSISRLLAEIGNKNLAIQPSQKEEDRLDSHSPLDSNSWWLVLTMETPFYINGIVATVTQKIADAQGNIFKADAKQKKDNLGILKIYLSVSENRIVDLLDNLYEIQFEDINEFNNSEQFGKAYELLLSLNKMPKLEPMANENVNEKIKTNLSKQRVILSIECNFGIELIAKNKRGTLAEITNKIASNGIMISSVQQKFNIIQEKDIFEFFLEVIPKGSKEEI